MATPFGTNRDKPDMPYTPSVWRRFLFRLGFRWQVGTSDESGLLPPSGGGTVNFYRADGTFAEPPSGGGGGTPTTGGNTSISTAILDGSSSSETEIAVPLVVASDTMQLTDGADDMGVPVFMQMKATRVAVAWKSVNGTGPGPGDWTLRLHRKPVGGDMAEVATFTVKTNNQ